MHGEQDAIHEYHDGDDDLLTRFDGEARVVILKSLNLPDARILTARSRASGED